jgi:hypothetical protein
MKEDLRQKMVNELIIENMKDLEDLTNVEKMNHQETEPLKIGMTARKPRQFSLRTFPGMTARKLRQFSQKNILQKEQEQQLNH